MNCNSSDDFIKVCIRIRPPESNGVGSFRNSCIEASDDCRIVIPATNKQFTFDYVANCDATQESIFRKVGKRLIDGCFDGYNASVFAYGQTGSGKTYTMLGSDPVYRVEDPTKMDSFSSGGLIPRCLDYLFSLIERQKTLDASDSMEFLCKCSFIEIYQENVYDLLSFDDSNNLQVRENIKSGTFVEGVTEAVVGSAVEAFKLLERGWQRRTVAFTSMNRESSRSHAVFIFFLESKKKSNDVVSIRTSKLNFVDLAGSERQRDTNTTDLRLKEAGCINKTLSVLGNVMTALMHRSQGKNRHVPYRDSKLTFLLRDSLGGNSRTCIIATVHPHPKCFSETLSTLQFAQSAKKVKNNVVANEGILGKNTIALELEIKRLRQEIIDLKSKRRSVGPNYPNQNAHQQLIEFDFSQTFSSPVFSSPISDINPGVGLNLCKIGNGLEFCSTNEDELKKEYQKLKIEHAKCSIEIKQKNKDIDELKMELKASRFQRQLQSEHHVNVVQALTPTRKSRRRTVYTPGPVKGCSPDLKLELGERCNYNEMDRESLLEHLNKITELNLDLEQRFEIQQREILRLETEYDCLNQIAANQKSAMEKQSIDFCDDKHKFLKQIEEMNVLLRNAQQEAEFYRGESQDLKVLLDHAEDKLQGFYVDFDGQAMIERLQTLQKTVDDLRESEEILTEDRNKLFDRNLQLEAQCSLNVDVLQEMDERLEAEKAKNQKQVNDEIATLYQEIADFKKHNLELIEMNEKLNEESSQLKHMLKSEGLHFQTESKKCYELLVENERLKGDVNELRNQNEELAKFMETTIIQQVKDKSPLPDTNLCKRCCRFTGINTMDDTDFKVSLPNLNSQPCYESDDRFSIEQHNILKNYHDQMTTFDSVIEEYNEKLNEKNVEIDQLKNSLQIVQRQIDEFKNQSGRKTPDDVEEIRQKLQENETKLMEHVDENLRLKTERQNEALNFDKIDQERSRLFEENQKLRTVEADLFMEKENLKSSIRELEEIKINKDMIINKLNKKLSAEESENAKLAGHTNKKQRIHYVETLRNEAASLREENLKLKRENEQIKNSQQNGNGSCSSNRKCSK